MSGFAEKILDSFMDRKKSDSDQNNNDAYYQQGQQQQQPYQPAPYTQSQPQQPPYPWITRWDDREQRYIYINEQTGERSYTLPGASQGGYGGGGESYGYPNQPSQQQGYYNSGEPAPEQREEKSSGHGSAAAWGAGGLALGLGAGALAMHEGEEISEFFCLYFFIAFGFFSYVYPLSPHLPHLTITSNSKKELNQITNTTAEDEWNQAESSISRSASDFPENAAEWTGERVGEAEQLPERAEEGFDEFGDGVERKWDGAVEGVEEAPENVAEWVGEGVGEVQGFGDDVQEFGDDMGDAYDEGREEGRED